MAPSIRRSRRHKLSIETLEARLAPAANPIVTENALPGNPQSEWGIVGSGDPTIQGYATNFSVNKGQTVSFKVDDTSLANYRIDIYRIGFYQGNGARIIATIPSSQTLKQSQPAALYDPATNLVDAGNWAVSASWSVPTTAVSGVYIARLVREDTGGASHIIFVVRDDSSNSDILFQTSDTTWQAYNSWGGWSLYGGTNGQRAFKVSYNRPFNTRTNTVNGRDFFFGVEYAQVRFLEANGYNVSYFSGIDGDRYGAEIREHRTYLTAGHDEYWSGPQRSAVELARDAGVNMAFFTGNDMYWKIRWENSQDGSNTPYRTMVCYKESLADASIDPSNSWTGLWRDSRFAVSPETMVPENNIVGTIFTVNRGPGGETGTSFNVPEADGKMRFWRDTSVATLGAGQTAVLGDQVLGYEWNEDLDNGYRPAGLLQMSSTTQNVPEKLLDLGKTTGPGTATHSLTMYRDDSGAIVFSAGTVQWAWGLDGTHDGPQTTPSTPMRQATINLLADMGVQPETLQTGLVKASASNDATVPTTVITSHTNGTTFTAGEVYTLSGTASDGGGGRVAGVEISTDGGQTWRRATGRTSWTYSWTPAITGPVEIKVRAVDDSGNLNVAGSAITGTVALTATASIGLVGAWSFDSVSGGTTADAAGNDNPGTVSGATSVAGGKFGNGLQFDGINDWVTVADANALDFTNGMTLQAWVKPTALSNFSTVMLKELGTNGLAYALYAADGSNNPPSAYVHIGSSDPFVRATGTLPLNAWSHLAATYDGGTLRYYMNGSLVATQAASGNITTTTGSLRIGGNNVWGEYFQGTIDDVRVYNRALAENEIRFDMSTPIGGTTDATAPTATISSPTNNATVSGNVTLTTSASDNVIVSGVQFYLNGQPLGAEDTLAPFSMVWNSTTYPNGSYQLTARVRDAIGNSYITPATNVTVSNAADTTAPNVALALPVAGTLAGAPIVLQATTSDNVGVVGVQFKVGGANVGTEDTSAPFRMSWDPASFADGSYSVTAVARDAAGNTTTSAAVPIVVDKTAPTIVTKTPAANATNVNTTDNIQVVFSESVELSGLSFVLKDSSNNVMVTQASYNDATKTISFAPTTLNLNATYTATISGVKDWAGNTMAGSVTWSFTTGAVVVNNTLFDAGTTPTVQSVSDTAAIELGVKFKADIPGYITGVRFFKGAANIGTHIGRLWDVNGNLLGSVTFTNESASGWQQADFTTPIAIVANTMYLVSYYAPNGGYSHNSNYFGGDVVNDHLIGLANSNGGNGVYLYATGGGLPTQSFNAANYWVDAVFSNVLTDTTAPTLSNRTPASGATGVASSVAPTATFSESVQSSTISFTLKDAANNPVAATAAYDDASKTITLTPGSPLGTNATYTLTLSGAKDLAGNTMTLTSWSFTTMPVDTAAPTVVSRTPTPNATAVAPAETVSATFNESVQPSTISLVLLDNNNVPVPATLTYNDANKTVSFKPTPFNGLPPGCCGTCSHCPLATSTQYTATLSGAKDLAGNTMSTVTWSFTTDAAIVGVSVFGLNATPAVASANDFAPIELGVKVRSDKTGYLTGVRFFKGAYNTGTHTGRVWSDAGQLLGSVDFGNESASGWQQGDFASPILVQANTTYVVSYYAPAGGYAYTSSYFANGGAGDGVLKALANSAGGNGLYRYGTGGGFPTQSYNATNYWVDAVFANTINDVQAPTVASVTPAANATGVPINVLPSVTFSEPVQQPSITFELRDSNNNLIPGTVTYDSSTNKATLTPNAALNSQATYTAKVSGVVDLVGNSMVGAQTWTFTTGGVVSSATIWANSFVPTNTSASDNAAIELGTKFRSTTAGFITGIRFYKGSANTGTHIGNLWDANGNNLGAVTFTNESATGWQQALLSTPVAIAANTTYVVSYHAPNGGYAYDHGYFANAGVANSVLYALSSGEGSGNGVYKYGTSSFPTNSYNSTNYWVDVVFTQDLGDTTAPTIASRSPGVSATGVSTDTNVTATFSEAVVAGSAAVVVRDSSNNVVSGSLTYNSGTNTATFDPTSNLIPLHTYTVTVTGAKDPSNNTMTSSSWSFTTKGTWRQSSADDFAGGTASGIAVSDQNGGALQLAASFDEQFSGTALGSAWQSASWTSQGGGTTVISVGSGSLSVQGGTASTATTYPGVGVEGRVAFAANPYQHFGLATGLDSVSGNYWAIFSTGGTSNTLYARVNASGTVQDVNLGSLPSGYHNYKISPTSSGYQFYVDGVLQTTVNVSFPVGTGVRFMFSSFNGGAALLADSVKAVSFSSTGTFTSAIFDAGQAVSWQKVSWATSTPTGTSVKVEIIVSNDNSTWSNWLEVSNAATLANVSGRYVRYRVTLTTSDASLTPVFEEISLDFGTL